MTDRYAVVGNPIRHSLSPEIHAMFARETGEDISYEKIEIPLGEFSRRVRELMDEGFKGLNVTLPFKVDAYKFSDRLTDRARLCGAVNTLVFGRKVTGDNTDGTGFITDVENRLGFGIEGASVLVLGAGGGVRGLLPSLLNANPKWIAVANRTLSRAEALAETFGIDAVSYEETVSDQFDLVINATSTSLSNVAPPVPAAVFSRVKLAYDLVYSAKPTPFMELARSGGAAAVSDGLGMLVEQAAESFMDWRGVRPETPRVYEAVRKMIETV